MDDPNVPLLSAQESWFRAVNRFSVDTPWLHTPARLYAEYGVVLFAVLLLGAWWLARRTGDPRKVAAALWAPIGALVVIGLNQPLTHAVGEVRPYTIFPHALTLVARSTDLSFPSDHSVMAGAAALGVLLANRRLGLLTAALAVLMAVTRVYVGAHWPLDVVAGLVVGAGLAAIVYAVVRPLLVRIVERLGASPLHVLVR